MSWLFAAPEARESLLCIAALSAEWQALLDAGTEITVAHLKLAWWQEELGRLAAGNPLHPITRRLAALPRAGTAELGSLTAVVGAVTAQVAGVPVERATDLPAHADALYGTPLRVAARLAGSDEVRGGLSTCISALATARYLARAIADYSTDCRVGRIPFAVDELLAVGIDNADLAADPPPEALANYLRRLRARACECLTTATTALPATDRRRLRHLLVLAALDRRHLDAGGRRPTAYTRVGDLYVAWHTARRAAAD